MLGEQHNLHQAAASQDRPTQRPFLKPYKLKHLIALARDKQNKATGMTTSRMRYLKHVRARASDDALHKKHSTHSLYYRKSRSGRNLSSTYLNLYTATVGRAETVPQAEMPVQVITSQPPKGPQSQCGGGKAVTKNRVRPQTEMQTVWVDPTSIPLTIKSDGIVIHAYVESQNSLQCGAHALNAVLARQAAKEPRFLYTDLSATRAPQRNVRDPITHYRTSGMYSTKAINHWLYEHTTTQVVIAHVVTGQRAVGPSVGYAQEEILARAPASCRAFIVHVGEAENGHYKAWVESDGQWYECDSLTCTSAANRVKRLTPEDCMQTAAPSAA